MAKWSAPIRKGTWKYSASIKTEIDKDIKERVAKMRDIQRVLEALAITIEWRAKVAHAEMRANAKNSKGESSIDRVRATERVDWWIDLVDPGGPAAAWAIERRKRIISDLMRPGL